MLGFFAPAGCARTVAGMIPAITVASAPATRLAFALCAHHDSSRVPKPSVCYQSVRPSVSGSEQERQEDLEVCCAHRCRQAGARAPRIRASEAVDRSVVDGSSCALGFLQLRRATNGLEHVPAGSGLAEVRGAACGLRLLAGLGLVVRGDVDDGGRRAGRLEPPVELDAGHAAQLDVEHQAVEQRPLGVGEECLGGEIADRLDPLRPEQATQGTARALVIIDDGDVRLAKERSSGRDEYATPCRATGTTAL